MGIHDGHREKMRSRFLKTGLEGFADHESLELLLYYAIPRRDTNPIAHALMERYGSLSAVLSAPVEDLQKVEGIGESAAILVHLVALLNQRARLNEAERDIILNSTAKACQYLLELYRNERNEVVYALFMDRKGKLLRCRRLSEGGVSGTSLNLRGLVETAMLTGASGVVLSHNHPSGVALPSQADYTATDQARQTLSSIGVDLLDHIIVADRDCVSMADSGYFA